MNNNVIIILAAGESSRMQHPKQLLIYKDQTLLSHTITEAQKSLMPVVVVLGSKAKKIMSDLKDVAINVVENKNWKSGMASSIQAGLIRAIEIFPEMENCILAVCDQPYISALLFQQLLDEKKQSPKNIVACSYAKTLGTPSLFNKGYFEDLLNLKGDHGAKNLLQKYSHDVASITFEKGKIDIDTKKDYEQLLNDKS